MPHLAAGAGRAFAIEMDAGAIVCEQFRPIICGITDQIFHLDPVDEQMCCAKRQVANGADMVFELAGGCPRR